MVKKGSLELKAVQSEGADIMVESMVMTKNETDIWIHYQNSIKLHIHCVNIFFVMLRCMVCFYQHNALASSAEGLLLF